jgi:hypothetical protein
MHYLIYIPGAEEPNDNLLDSVGQGKLKSTGLPVNWTRIIQGGPDGKQGMIASWHNRDERDADPMQHREFEWTPARKLRDLEEGRFWLGVSKDSPVTPHDLELPTRFNGHIVACADGNNWHIPSASRLPHMHGLNESGEWERRVQNKYREFHDNAKAYGTQLFAEVDAVAMLETKDEDRPVATVELNDTDKHCCTALMLNYRLTPEIIDLLGILDDDSMVAIISATMDLPDILKVLGQKKRSCPVGIPVG